MTKRQGQTHGNHSRAHGCSGGMNKSSRAWFPADDDTAVLRPDRAERVPAYIYRIYADRAPEMTTLRRSVAILWPVHIAFIFGKVLLNRSIGMTDRFHSICPVHLYEHINGFMNSITCRFTEPRVESTRERFFAIYWGHCALSC